MPYESLWKLALDVH
jgi:hypothetical protein